MATQFVHQAIIDQRRGSMAVKPVCLWAQGVVSECIC